MVQKLTKYDLQKLEEYWINHANNKRLLQFREWELTAKVNDDESGVHGSGISKPTEVLAQKLLLDRKYQNLKLIIDVVEKLYKEADSDIRTIVDMRYWDK